MKPNPLPCLLAFVVAALFPLAAWAQDSTAAAKPLGDYRDKNRVLLVFAPTEQDPACREQYKLLQGEKAELEERQIVVLPVFADARKPAGDPPGALAKRFGIDPKTFAVILVGKDGHDAYRSAKPLPAATLYATVDAMPMRRAEMKRPPATASPSPMPRPTPAKPDLDHDE